MNETDKLSIILPCRNQADHILGVVENFHRVLSESTFDFELIVVPNASTDNTADVVRSFSKGKDNIQVVESLEGGWGRSVLLGLSKARGNVLCYTNTARTEPQTIISLYQIYTGNIPCLAKVRRSKRGMLTRSLGSFFYNLEASMLFGIGLSDVNGTPKIFSRSFYEQLNLQMQNDLIDLELMAKAKRLNAKVIEMTTEGFTRHGGKSSTNWKSALKMYSGAFSLRFFNNAALKTRQGE